MIHDSYISMITRELINYIKQSLAQGQPKEQIKSVLLEQGWQAEDIEQGFKESGFGAESSAPSQSGPETKAVLISVGDLFRQSWGFYKKNFLKLIAIAGLPYILLLILLILGFFDIFSRQNQSLNIQETTTGLGGVILPFAIYLIIFIAYIILSIWATIAFLYFIKDRGENIGFLESYKRSVKKLHSYIWVSIISALVIAGSSVLLVVPGIITAIWIVFAVYVLIWEDKKGFSALARSRELVRGYWGKVFGSLLALAVFPLFIVLISFWVGIFAGSSLKNIINSALGFLIGPFAAYYSYLIYDSLVKIKGPSVVLPKKKWFVATFIIGIIAILLIPVILFFVVLGSLNKDKLKAKDAAIKMALIEMRSWAEIDFEMNGDYSAACVETGGEAGNSAIAYTDIATNIINNGGSGVCNESASGKSWAAWSKLASKPSKYWCVDSSGSSRELNTEPSQGSVHCPGVPR